MGRPGGESGEPARAVAARSRTLLRYLAATSVAVILVGACCLAVILAVTPPRVTAAVGA